ncbi:MAG: family transcriptional regulator [Holophagaceae bacterium]|nr:family transcriptional regulator [Holophagaceae bacterium]
MSTRRGAYRGKGSAGIPSTLGERIRSIRLAWGWTQKTLAQTLGSAQSLVSEWEKDIGKPSGAPLTALAKLFRVSQTALETGEGFKIPEPPDARPNGGLMSKREMEDLRGLLPKLKVGEILQVDTDSLDSELVDLKEALAIIREAKKQGRSVWLVVGEAEDKAKG